MKKIILYLGLLFTYYVSIRFISSSINQDDFNYSNASSTISLIFMVLILICIFIYNIYQNKIKRSNQLIIRDFLNNKKKLEQEHKTLNLKLALLTDFNNNLNERISTIKNEMLFVEKNISKKHESRVKEIINALEIIVNYCKLV